MHDGSFGLLGSGMYLTHVAAIGPNGEPQVILPGGAACSVRSLVPIAESDVGREAVVAPLGDDVLLIGLLQPSGPAVVVAGKPERHIIEADREVEIRCGKASIRLTADGRVTIRGTQVLSRAEGPNRVQGASVQLN